MKKIALTIVSFVLATLFSQAALAGDPPAAGDKTFSDQVCEALKECKDDTAKNPTIRYVPQYVCQGDFLPAKSNFAHPCVCAEGKLPYVLNYGWEILPRINPAQPNVRFYKATIYCGESPETIRRDLGLVQKDVKALFEDLKGYKEYVNSVFGHIANELKRVEGIAVVADKKADKAQQTADEAKEDARKASELAQSRPTRAWVLAHRVHFTPSAGLAYAAIPGSSMGFGVLDVALGGLFGEEGNVGLDVGGRFMFSPGGLNSGTYPTGSKSGQTYGVGAYTRLTFALSDDKRTRIGVGGSYTQFGRFNNNAERLGAITGLDLAFMIPLSEQAIVVPFGTLGSAMVGDGPERKTGIGGMLGVTLGVTF